MISVILSGGVGSRLWPLSRGMYPKQLLPLVDPEQSMLQQTINRVNSVDAGQKRIVVCNEEHRFIVAEQLQQINQHNSIILLEPEGRNTAPAIAISAFTALRADDDAILLVMPADHVMADEVSFLESVKVAEKLASEGALVTFGIVPTSPETGYGYIKAGQGGADTGFLVEAFKEKPDAATAQEYVEQGSYFWNGGIFVFRARDYLAELKSFEPEIYQASERAIEAAQNDLDFIRVDAEAFSQSPSKSIDYAVMERTRNAKMLPLDVGWDDVGSWSALWGVLSKDANENSISGDVLVHDTVNSHIHSETKLVSAVGVDGLIIVETDDAVLVASRERAQDVKEIVGKLDTAERSQTRHHRKVYRPWGWYDSIDSGPRFQVKRIQVKPGARLSVQMHHKRAEHWVVVKGVAEVLNGDKTFELRENESTYIPIGVTHALRNPSETEPLEIIEVQSGSYLGEDDIVRFEDNYGRA